MRSEALAAEELQIIVGALLGDGCISLTKQGRGMFNVSHTARHEGYFLWKLRSLPRLFMENHNIQRVVREKRGRPCESLFSYSIVRDELTEMRRLFYPRGRKIVPANIGRLLSPLAIAVWYMDDGSMELRGRSVRFTLATCGFGRISIERLRAVLANLGISSKKNGDPRRKRCVLRIGRKDSADRFCSMIRPYIHPVFHYKLP